MTVTAPALPQSTSPAGVTRRKATNREQQERDALPARIEALEDEQRRLNADVEGPDFYKRSPVDIAATMARLAELPDEILRAYARWDELEQLR